LLLALLESLKLVEALDKFRVVLPQGVDSALRVDKLEESVNVGLDLEACERGPLEVDAVLVEL